MARSTKSPQALATTLCMRGRMLQTLKRDDEARIAFERALKVDAPNDTITLDIIPT